MHLGVQSEVHPRSPLQLLLKLTRLVFWTKKKPLCISAKRFLFMP